MWAKREGVWAKKEGVWPKSAFLANFKARAACILDLFGSYELYGRHVNGRLTLGVRARRAAVLK